MPHVTDLGDFGLQPIGKIVERLVRPPRHGFRLRRERQHDHRHVIDPAHSHLRRWHARRDAVAIRRKPFLDPGRCVLGPGADEKAGGDHHPLVLRQGINVLDAVHALNDGFEGLGNQFDRV